MSGVLAEGKGTVSQHQTSVTIKALAWSSQTPLCPHGPRRVQKTVLWNVAPLNCKTTPERQNHCAPPNHPLCPCTGSGQRRWWGLWAGSVLSHACGCSHEHPNKLCHFCTHSRWLSFLFSCQSALSPKGKEILDVTTVCGLTKCPKYINRCTERGWH